MGVKEFIEYAYKTGNLPEVEYKKYIEQLESTLPSAKEMFEKLGYEQDKFMGRFMGYRKNIDETTIKYITFINTGNSQYFTLIETDKDNPSLNIKELEAINKQVEELGWK